ncbi:MAG: ribonucleoside-diphosphate reductase subunit alpha [Alphaproteobacteria bacterium]|nr:ribonucleoside-diphosphate reductase subunit alpha [Alphaproteobacteria bacterium]
MHPLELPVLDETITTPADVAADAPSLEQHPLLDYLQPKAADLPHLDPEALTRRVLSAARAGADLGALRELVIHDAATRTFEEPEYSKLAARVLADEIREEAVAEGATSFSSSIAASYAVGLVNERVRAFVTAHAEALDAAVVDERDGWFEYFGLKTVRDRYLLRHPERRTVLETPQYFFLRVACGVSDELADALELYEVFSHHDYLPSSPTLFNAGTTREQLSSCFLLDSPADDLRDIYKRYADIAMLSKFAGGIGLSYTRVRSQGSHIKGTNGLSNGIVPFLNTLDASVAAVNQGGRRKGACCVYLEPWHGDIEAFLELRENTGDEARRTYNLNIANWVPDLFMRRVEAGGDWSLFDPKEVPDLVDTWGPAFEARYEAYEAEGKALKTVKARELYARMMRTLAQTGNGWMCFKDASNRACNQTGEPGNVVHLSNLCTEIIEVTNGGETAVCNLGSINLSHHCDGDGFDFAKLAATTRKAIRQLDRVIDRNLYPIPEAKASNMRWRPVGLGMMGLQDVFFKLRLAFDSDEAREISRRISETVYFHAVSASCELAAELGAHTSFPETRAAKGELQFDAWDVTPSAEHDWAGLRARVQAQGLRNSLLIAIAPTATIASIVGCFECIEPQVSNLFKRETLSGEFLQVNRYLVADLRDLGLWNAETRAVIKEQNGSVQGLADLPQAQRDLYRTAWELSMKSLVDLAADRGAFIDQSQSLNLFQEQPNIGKLSSMYMYAWKRGLKTTYYLRSRPATRIAQTSTYSPAAAVACSLENPEYCEACQ